MFLELYLKNKNLIKEGLYYLKIYQNTAGSRRAVMDSIVPYIADSSSSLFITLDGRYDVSSQPQLSVEGLRSTTLNLLELGYWD